MVLHLAMMKLPHWISKLWVPISAIYQRWYPAKPKVFTYKNVSVSIHPEVFSPIGDEASMLLLDYVDAQDLAHKTVLDLGCGSGIVSVLAASKGALVTASDINETAIQMLAEKARSEALNIISVYSNLFENHTFHFDYIFIHPPLMANTAHFQAFYNTLFGQLYTRGVSDAKVVMVISDDNDFQSVQREVETHQLQLHPLQRIKKGKSTTGLFQVEAKKLA